MADDKKTRIGTPMPPSARPQTGAQPALQPVPTPPPVAAPYGTAPPSVQVSQSALYSAQTPVPITQAPIAPAPTPAPAGATAYLPNVPAAGAPVYVPPPDPLVNQVLNGRYLVQKKLGEGGMGAVYLATHIVLEKQVALKVLHGEFARKQDLVERFMQEAKAASRIRHENVIDISDFGQAGEGVVFFAMELLKGHDLHEEIARARLAGQRLPWARTRPIFLQICSALAAAHAMGVVHRDLKPENIYLVEWLGHKDFVKLLDFGIAKLTEVSEGDRKLTRTGMLFGTPEYMSPEQARGEPVDHRVDVYAMGCILYQLVTGRVPFEADNFMGILSLHLTEEVPPIPPPIFAEIGAPPEIEYVIQRAMAKQREDRFQSIDEMANAIRALHGEEERPVQAPRVPLATPAPRSPTRPKSEWTGSLAVPADTAVTEVPRSRSKAPWIALAVLAAGGGGAAALFLGGGKAGAGSGTGTDAPVAIVVDAGAGAGTASAPPPPPPPEPPIPARVTLVLDSVPQGADIYDMTSKEIVGQTPMDFEVPGSKDPRRYTFKRKGYSGKMIELIPVENVTYKAELKKLAKGQHEEPVQLEVVPQKVRRPTPPVPGPGVPLVAAGAIDAGVPVDDGPSTKPDPVPGSGGTRPDPTPGSGSTRPPDPTPGSGSTKPPDPTPGSGGSGTTKPPDPTPGSGSDDDDLPGLKGFPDPNKPK